ncbi:MAG: 4-hydroxy-tetrahydrodipicolinate reductase [Mariprofundaceae bacterium]|nr:4-hydroxy-tetrahydrodipicolinate reductase [Mariprofundaceae bacterium]
MHKVIIVGASGRMGRMLVRAVAESEHAKLVAATEREGSTLLGVDAGELAGVQTLGVAIHSSIPEGLDADVIIDFTTPKATLAHAKLAAQRGIQMVIGTTGLDKNELQTLSAILAASATVKASNFSVGVTLALQLIEQAAAVLEADYDAEIIEAHHRHKVDAPSGTALSMGEALATGRQVALDDVAVYSREGIVGARESGSIGFSVVRGGDIVGKHQVLFAGLGESLEIQHTATDRMTFARGALRAALWVGDQEAGLYDMRDVLGLN